MTSLAAGQIVYLECRQIRLYAEVIQVLEARQMAWLRPLALVSGATLQPLNQGGWGEGISELSTTPDVVWPLAPLQPALDSEAIPLLTQLGSKALEGSLGHEPRPTAAPRLTLQGFVDILWADSRALGLGTGGDYYSGNPEDLD